MDQTLQTKKFVGKDSANFKQVIEFDGRHDNNSMSFDTGVNGNILGGHYFDANEDHINGKLKSIETYNAYDDSKFSKLVINAKSVSHGMKLGRAESYIESMKNFIRSFK